MVKYREIDEGLFESIASYLSLNLDEAAVREEQGEIFHQPIVLSQKQSVQRRERRRPESSADHPPVAKKVSMLVSADEPDWSDEALEDIWTGEAADAEEPSVIDEATEGRPDAFQSAADIYGVFGELSDLPEPVQAGGTVPILQPEESFSGMLLRMIDEKGMSDPDAYHKAWVDRRVFSKIRSNPEYTPRKQTAVAFALALELNREETDELLMKAGYALSNASKWDLIIAYCVEHRIFRLYEVNCILHAFDLPLLG